MARSPYRTMGLLNRWPEAMMVDIFHFNQITGAGTNATRSNASRNIYVEPERDYIARSISEALIKARDYLGFYPSPEWVLSEPLVIQSDYTWDSQTYELDYGHLESIGKRAVTLISENVSVVYTDEDEDGIDETASVTVTTAIDPGEIQAFFRTADGADEAASEYWQIDRLRATASGGVVTLKGHRGLFAHPAVWAKSYVGGSYENKFSGDTGDANAFVAAVDVYRVYSDPVYAIEVTQDARYVEAGELTVYASANIVDHRTGKITLYTADTQATPTAINEIRVWYKAGLPLVNGNMQTGIETALIRYANTLMPQQPALIEPLLDMWLQDRAYSKQLKMKVGSLAALTVLKPIRMALKARVDEWYPDAPPTDG